MSYVRAAANLILDNPHADGHITQFGIGRDWQAEERRLTGSWAWDLATPLGWEYAGQFEYLDKLKAVAPLGTYTPADMALSDWTVTQGKWQESSSSGALRYKHLHFYDGRPGLFATSEYGILTSKASFRPNLFCGVWRFPADKTETDPCVFEIHFLGDGTSPVYVLGFPAPGPGGNYYQGGPTVNSEQYTHPLLMAHMPGQTAWSIIDEARGGAPQAGGDLNQKAYWQGLRIEYTDGWLLVRQHGQDEAWAYSGNWTDAGGVTRNFALVDGPIQLRVCGHTAQVTLAPLTYPASAVLRPSGWFVTAPTVNPTPSYMAVRAEPAGTAIAVATEGGSGRCRPAVTFTGGNDRAVLYNLMEYRAATVGGAVSNPGQTLGNEALKLKSLSGELTSSWHGGTLEAELEARLGHTMAELTPNCKVTGKVSLDAGSTYTTLFTGYSTPAEKWLNESKLGRTKATLHAVDWIEARGKHHQLYGHCSYEGWPVDDAFEYLLNRAGVPSSLIAVDAGVSAAVLGPYYYLPIGNPKGERCLQFRVDENIVAALDQICELRDLQWGVNQLGVCFLRRRLTHTAGHYDYTVDDDSADASNLLAFKHVRSVQDYFNVLLVLSGEGFSMAARQLVDMDSIGTYGSADYVGEDWWRVEAQPEGDNPDLIANRLWQQRSENAHLIYWKTSAHVELLPDQELRVQVSGVDVPTNSIYRITRKAWRVDDPEGANRLSQEIEAVLVEVGS